jgi:hypothetical protein
MPLAKYSSGKGARQLDSEELVESKDTFLA